MSTAGFFIFYILAFVSEVLGTISGFGSSILFVPLSSYFFDLKTVLGLTALFHVFSNLSKIFLFREGVDKQVMLKLGIPAIVFVSVGAVLSNFVSTLYLELLLSAFLILISIFLFFNSERKIERTNRNLISSGILSGFLAGLIGTGGAVRGVTLASIHLQKQSFIATSAMIDFGVDTSRAVIYSVQGYVTRDVLYLLPVLILVSYFGTLAGKFLLKYMSEAVFKKWVLGLVIVTALAQGIQILNDGA
ncbi:MAG: sulfite exporter TauE/SafE family protein [Saprospiraceae bacterium]|nr:sulfite exporter TauE/SafE family protein [Saprospiraceae bacterium]